MDRVCRACQFEDNGYCTVGKKKAKPIPKKKTCHRFVPRYEGYDTPSILKRVKNDISRLESKANGWDQVLEYFRKEPRIQPYLEDIQEQMHAANSQSAVAMIISTVELILERIIEYEEEMV